MLRAIVTQCLMYLSELILLCHKMFNVKDRKKTKQDQKVLVFNPYLN
jgi:hypothetical protein